MVGMATVDSVGQVNVLIATHPAPVIVIVAVSAEVPPMLNATRMLYCWPATKFSPAISVVYGDEGDGENLLAKKLEIGVAGATRSGANVPRRMYVVLVTGVVLTFTV